MHCVIGTHGLDEDPTSTQGPFQRVWLSGTKDYSCPIQIRYLMCVCTTYVRTYVCVYCHFLYVYTHMYMYIIDTCTCIQECNIVCIMVHNMCTTLLFVHVYVYIILFVYPGVVLSMLTYTGCQTQGT